MTLREFVTLVGADRKWVLNTRAALGHGKEYTLAGARRLAVARAISEACQIPMRPAYELGGKALAGYQRGENPVPLLRGAGVVVLSIDVYRILADLSARLSAFRTLGAPRKRGPRPALVRTPVEAAREFGLDISLLTANLGRTPAQRLRQLDSMMSFRRGVRLGSGRRKRNV